MWSETARWPGPDDDPGYRKAIEHGMLSEGPAAVRERVRDWLTALLHGEGVEIVPEEPADWSGWDRELRR
jgi:hypothetical protein